mgnify:CR=1 FL=1
MITIGVHQVDISITKKPEFTEVWYSGYIVYAGQTYDFWLIDPQGTDSRGYEYEVDVRWFFKRVPMEVRRLESEIKKYYLERNDKGNKQE